MPPTERRTKIACLVAVAALICAIWCVSVLMLRSERQNAIQIASSNGANLAVAFQYEVLHTLDAVTHVARSVIRFVHAADDRLADFSWSPDPDLAAPEIDQVSLIGADGRLRWSSLDAHVSRLDLGDREHFRVHLERRIDGLFIATPVVGRVSHRATIQISRRIEARDGRFLGVVVVSLSPAQLTTLHRSIALGAQGTIALIGLDNVVRARFTGPQSKGLDGIGVSVEGGPRPSDIAPGARGVYLRTSVIDGIRRIYNYQRVGDYPLVVTVGQELGAALADYRLHARRTLVVAFVATMLLCAWCIYLMRGTDLRAERDAELAAEHLRLQEVNQELKRAIERRDLAESASQAKSVFLANMSHELRTPLNAIIGFSQIIRDRLMGPSAIELYAGYARDICNAGEHLLDMINRILDLSKIEAGKLELSPELLELGSVVAASVMVVRPQAERKNIAIAAHMADPAPIVIADEVALRQILINILGNAIKFTPEGGSVTVASEKNASGTLALTITDTGIGIAADDISVALEPFRQIDNAMTKRHEGTGLGLPLAKRLIELHGGTLAISSRLGRGTTVRICLPAAPLMVDPAAANAA